MLGLSGTSSYDVFVYLCICIFVFEYLTPWNVIFDILEQSSFQKYAIYWVSQLIGQNMGRYMARYMADQGGMCLTCSQEICV